MDKFYQMDWKITAGIYGLLAIIATGMGMGVPIFTILLGFPAGWWIAAYCVRKYPKIESSIQRVLLFSAFTAAFTLFMMLVIWAPLLSKLWEADVKYEEIGIPLILYDPFWSFIGWEMLMIFISPFLQFLMSLLGINLYWMWWYAREQGVSPETTSAKL